VGIANNDDPKWKEVQTRIAAALAPFSQDLGARVCAHGNWTQCDDCEYSETQPKPDSMTMITDFVIVFTTSDATRDDPILGTVSSPNQLHHTTQGLLHVSLFEGT
jgi:hypothetical protein